MVLTRVGGPFEAIERDLPAPGSGQVLVKVAACGVCRTDLHVVDGELASVPLPIIPGHEVVGHITVLGIVVTGVNAAAKMHQLARARMHQAG